MLTCRQASELLSDRLDGKLPPIEHLHLRMHLAVCKACRRVAAQLGFVHDAVVELPKVLRED